MSNELSQRPIERNCSTFHLYLDCEQSLFCSKICKREYRKIPKISPAAYIFQRSFLRGLSRREICVSTIDCASLIVGSKFTVFTLFYFVFEGNFPRTSPWGAYIWRGDLTEGFLRYRFGGLIFGGAYTRRGLFRNFTVFEQQKNTLFQIFEQKRDCLQSSLYFTNSKKTENINILAIMFLSEFLTS